MIEKCRGLNSYIYHNRPIVVNMNLFQQVKLLLLIGMIVVNSFNHADTNNPVVSPRTAQSSK